MGQKQKIHKNKFLRNKRAFIFLLILCLGVGFAFLSTQLNITGNTSVSGNKWSVYFTNVQVTEGSVDASVVPTTTGTTTTSLNYTVLLDKPGDFYEFTVDAVNAGTIDAMVESINMTSLDTDVAKYLNYTATYSDGTVLAKNDVLEADDSATYKVRVEYKKNIEATDLDEDGVNLTLTFGVNYVQSNIVAPKTTESAFTKLVKSSALSDSGLNFAAISSDNNGKGLYIKTETEEDTYPIYYYRGAVTNNNAKFAGFCWKVVRTTETGGTKLIYNGLPDGNGQCTNTTGDDTQLQTTTAFADYDNSPAYNGYMYGTVYEISKVRVENNNYLYGSSFTFQDVNEAVSGDGTFTLTGTTTDISQVSTHHYTCLNTTGVCSELYYIYYKDDVPNVSYITLKDGKSVEDALSEIRNNTTSSVLKSNIDTWFNSTFKTYFTNLNKDYNDYLEDTVWCNDRGYIEDQNNNNAFSKSGWNPNGGDPGVYIRYSSFVRISSGQPSLTCSSKNNSFTVEESATGNGALTYPVGLLTTDEIILAGAASSDNSTFYLNTEKDWWTMTPATFNAGRALNYHFSSSGGFVYFTTTTYGVRPSISLKSSVKITDGGDGSSATPYEFIVE